MRHRQRPPAHTCSAASSVKPPAKTDVRAISDALAVRQEVEGPLDRVPQRLVPFPLRRARPAGEETEPLAESIEDLVAG